MPSYQPRIVCCGAWPAGDGVRRRSRSKPPVAPLQSITASASKTPSLVATAIWPRVALDAADRTAFVKLCAPALRLARQQLVELAAQQDGGLVVAAQLETRDRPFPAMIAPSIRNARRRTCSPTPSRSRNFSVQGDRSLPQAFVRGSALRSSSKHSTGVRRSREAHGRLHCRLGLRHITMVLRFLVTM